MQHRDASISSGRHRMICSWANSWDTAISTNTPSRMLSTILPRGSPSDRNTSTKQWEMKTAGSSSSESSAQFARVGGNKAREDSRRAETRPAIPPTSLLPANFPANSPHIPTTPREMPRPRDSSPRSAEKRSTRAVPGITAVFNTYLWGKCWEFSRQLSNVPVVFGHVWRRIGFSRQCVHGFVFLIFLVSRQILLITPLSRHTMHRHVSRQTRLLLRNPFRGSGGGSLGGLRRDGGKSDVVQVIAVFAVRNETAAVQK